MKRKAVDPLDLTADSEASATSPEREASTSTSNVKSKKKKKKKKKKKAHVEAPKHLDRVREHAKSGFAPRSVLLGGKGTGQETAGKLKSVRKDDGDDSDGPPTRRRRSAQLETPNQILPFRVAAKYDEDPGELLDRLVYGDPHLLLIERVKDGRGRPKKQQDSGGDDSDSSDDEQRDKPISIDTLIGPDPDKRLDSALFAAPQVKLPWLPKRLATMHRAKKRSEEVAYESLSEGEGVGTSGSTKKKPKTSQKVRPWTKKPLLIVQGEQVDPSAVEAKTVIHRPAAVDEDHSFHASFAMLFRESPDEKFHLRIAIGRPEATPEAWSGVEHAIWVKDLPRLAQPAQSVDANPTHTDFSRSLINFLRSDSLDLRKTGKVATARSAGLASLEQNLRLVDFTSSDTVRLVVSHAGSHEGAEGMSGAGGLTSLAKAVAALSPSCEGAGEWQLEYITPQVGVLSRKLLERLHAAAQGISPLEYADQQTERAQTAKAAFAASIGKPNDEKVKVLYPTEETVTACKETVGRHLIKWEGGKGLDELPKGDRRKTVLRQLDLKSGRLNGSALMVILHKPPASAGCDEAEPFEAFLYNGSHLPSPDSWGKYGRSPDAEKPMCELARTDLGVLYRCATASTAKKLEKKVSALVPYTRTPELALFGEDDEPASTVEQKEKKAPGRPKGSRNGDGQSKGKGKAGGKS